MLSLEVATKSQPPCRFSDPRWLQRPDALAVLLSRERGFFETLRLLANGAQSTTRQSRGKKSSSSSTSTSWPSLDDLALCLINSRLAFGGEARTFLLLPEAAIHRARKSEKEGEEKEGEEEEEEASKAATAATATAARRAERSNDRDQRDARRVVRETDAIILRSGVPPSPVYFSPSSLTPHAKADEIALRRSARAGLALVPVNFWTHWEDAAAVDDAAAGTEQADGRTWCRLLDQADRSSRSLRKRLVVVDRRWEQVRFARDVPINDLPLQIKRSRGSMQRRGLSASLLVQPPNTTVAGFSTARARPLDSVLRAAKATRDYKPPPSEKGTLRRRRRRGGVAKKGTGQERLSTKDLRVALDALTL